MNCDTKYSEFQTQKIHLTKKNTKHAKTLIAIGCMGGLCIYQLIYHKNQTWTCRYIYQSLVPWIRHEGLDIAQIKPTKALVRVAREDVGKDSSILFTKFSPVLKREPRIFRLREMNHLNQSHQFSGNVLLVFRGGGATKCGWAIEKKNTGRIRNPWVFLVVFLIGILTSWFVKSLYNWVGVHPL